MKCKALTKSGARCNGQAVGDGAYCFTHSPTHARARAEAHKLGGQHRLGVPNDKDFPAECDPQNAKGLLQLMDAVIREEWSLANSSRRNRTIGYLVGVQKAVLEVGELQNQIDAIRIEINTLLHPKVP